ncbi:MAG TPA: flagellar basal body-associated FliL family protein [Jatrophihabitans sp.]|jgi:flagellar FliL protein|uniref:flagellar basal body-associated FliL family protein n=1 Tax=Jatrophihabitans sp. TaxID=1932789 RepID=UPI002F1FE3A5
MTLTTDRPDRIANDIGLKTSKGGASEAEKGKGKGKGKETGKKKSKKTKIIILAVVFLVLGALAKFTVLAPSAPAHDAKPVPGVMVPMEEMTLNLAGGHYLRIKLALQTVHGAPEELDTAEAAQAVIEQFSDRTTVELTGDAARHKAKVALLAKLQKIYPEQLMDVIYTEYYMQ